ncbi:MAG: MBL fold metallo-hydrolase, partial [Planctomycetes bacterium]|nr:MBL fold metallo-hydrolase [Planctomycetota bacterium]
CAHAGVVNTLDYIVRLTGEKRIYAVIGGTHLLHASAKRVQYTIEALKRYDVHQIGLAHCTGDNAMQQIKNAFACKTFECLAGMQRKF